MAVYKVPQNVEADDKLLGPFSFRQFIYLIIVAMFCAMGWGLWQLFPPLVIIVVPGVLLFGALALPLRKDQPMEVYLAAILSFYLKPHIRFWDPDGIDSLVEVDAPKTESEHLTKDISQSDAEQRFGYLAQLVDSEGWAIRGASNAPGGPSVPVQNTSLNDDIYNEAQQTEDMFDSSGRINEAINKQIETSNTQHKETVMARMQQVVTTPVQPQPAQPTSTVKPVETAIEPELPHVVYNPYPTNIHQAVIQPGGNTVPSAQSATVNPQVIPPATSAAQITPSTSENTVSPDIIKLVNNAEGLSVDTLAREANRIKEREQRLGDEEVVISLR